MDVEIVESGSISPTQLAAWLHLFETEPDTRFYQHPHWFQCIAKHLSPGPLHIAFLNIDGELRMMLPLCSSAGDARRAHPAHDHLSLNDVLVHSSLKQNKTLFLDAIHHLLNGPGSRWSDWQLSNVPQQSALLQLMAELEPAIADNDAATNTLSINTQTGRANGRWMLNHSRYSASFDCRDDACPPQGKLRRNLRRLRKQLEETGDIRVENVTDADALPSAFEHFLAIEASGWKGAAQKATAINANESLTAFYKALLNPASAELQPEINLLWCNDECIAAQFGLRTDGCLSLLKIGYNENFARFSPGYLLLESILADTGARKIHTLSLVTSPPWADRWHPDTVPVWQIKHFNQTSMGIALHQFNRLKQAAKARLKQAA